MIYLDLFATQACPSIYWSVHVSFVFGYELVIELFVTLYVSASWRVCGLCGDCWHCSSWWHSMFQPPEGFVACVGIAGAVHPGDTLCFSLLKGLWPVWGLLTPFILVTLFMGIVVLVAMFGWVNMGLVTYMYCDTRVCVCVCSCTSCRRNS